MCMYYICVCMYVCTRAPVSIHNIELFSCLFMYYVPVYIDLKCQSFLSCIIYQALGEEAVQSKSNQPLQAVK